MSASPRRVLGRHGCGLIVLVSVSGLAAVGGCTTKSGQPPPSPSPAGSGGHSAVAPASSQPPSAGSSLAVAVAVLPTACSQLLPLGTLTHILGFGVLGQVTYLRAAPVPQSGRTGRVTCGYGAPAAIPSGVVSVVSPTPTSSAASARPAAAPLVEVSYITYTDAATAAARVQTTVEADGATAVVTQATVSGKAANILIGAAGSELLMSDGARTVVVVMSPTVVPAAKAPDVLTAIAESVVRFGRPTLAPVGSATAAVSSP